jgi:hypothetical protein
MALTQVAAGLLAGSITSSQITSVSGSTITGSQSIPKSTLPTGSVLQVVQAVTSTQVSTTSTSFVSTGFSASITPTSSTSKILISGSVIIRNGSGGNNYQHTIYRGGTQLAPNSARGFIQTRDASGNTSDMTPAFQFLDSPATTSSTTYTWYHKSEAGVLCYFAIDQSYAQITLMEISA